MTDAPEQLGGREARPIAGRIRVVPAVPIDLAIESWTAWMRLRELSDAQIKNSRNIVRKAARESGWGEVDDITPSAVVDYLERCKAAGRMPKSRNEYRSAISRFCDHAVREGWIRDNPCRNSPRAKVTKRRARITPSVEDVVALIDYARRDWRKRDRWLTYLAAATTGLRWGQLKGLEWEHVRLEADPPHFDLPARLCKNGEPAIVWLTAELAGALREARGREYDFTPNAGDAPEARVFRSVPKPTSFDRDLAGAGLRKGGGDRGTLSFHSLRHFASNRMAWLGGFSTAERQRQNQHRTEAMTTEIYTDPENLLLGRKVLAMPGLLAPSRLGADGGNPPGDLTPGLEIAHHADVTTTSHNHQTDPQAPAEASGVVVTTSPGAAAGPCGSINGASKSGRLDSNQEPRVAGRGSPASDRSGAAGQPAPGLDATAQGIIALALAAAEANLRLARALAERAGPCQGSGVDRQ